MINCLFSILDLSSSQHSVIVTANTFHLQQGMVDMTHLKTTDGLSNMNCAFICSADTTCYAYKPIRLDGRSDVMCEMYAELDASNSNPETDVYVKIE